MGYITQTLVESSQPPELKTKVSVEITVHLGWSPLRFLTCALPFLHPGSKPDQDQARVKEEEKKEADAFWQLGTNGRGISALREGEILILFLGTFVGGKVCFRTPGESGLVSRGSQGLRSPLESRRGHALLQGIFQTQGSNLYL